jgi:hypothetical protein
MLAAFLLCEILIDSCIACPNHYGALLLMTSWPNGTACQNCNVTQVTAI